MSKSILAAFGETLRQHRQKRGWSQEELAHRAGVDVSYLSEVETGKIEPCLLKMKALSHALEVTLAEMVRGV
jgi:transcriptional regulator with XRE-family HTH domain